MNIVVTGASRGIGRELVKQFLSNPESHVWALSRNEAALKEIETWNNQRKGNGDLFIRQVDLTSENLEDEMLPIIKECGHVDIVVNNAGLLINEKVTQLSADQARNMMEVNVIGPLRLLRSCYPALRKSPNPHVVNIGSMGGYQGSSKFPGLAVYSASKAALACLSECLAEEWKEENIKVNCLALGAVQTEMLEAAFPGFKAPVVPHDMANYVLEFALFGHKVYNGQVLPVTLSSP